MKASELMLGDWVSLFQGKKDGSPANVQVTSIDKYEIGVTGVDCDYDSATAPLLFPIPLTAAILLKNGFEHQMPYNDYVLDKKLSLYECGEGFAMNGGVGTFNERLQVDYVHELQHLLRLLRIDKEIAL